MALPGLGIMVVAVFAGACAKSSDNAKGSAGSTSMTLVAGAGTDAPSRDAAGGGSASAGQSGGAKPSAGQNPSGGQSGGGQGASGGQSSGGQNSGGSASGGPVIKSFSTPDSIDCHNGNFQQFTASWTTTNATKVTISIDGPGVYNTYPANGETSLPFNCSSSHTFLLTAYSADGKTATKSVTLQPRNVQPPTTPEDGDSPSMPSQP